MDFGAWHSAAGGFTLPDCYGCRTGESNSAIARRLFINRNTVILWRKPLARRVRRSLDIAAGRDESPGMKSIRSPPSWMRHCKPNRRDDALELPDDGREPGVGKFHGQQYLACPQLQPHRTKTFKLSRDPKFLEKMTDVVGLYLNPPQQAMVLCVDEKSQIQALDRTQPDCRLRKGVAGR